MTDLKDLARRVSELQGPWTAIGSVESEGFDCIWIKGQPSPALRGFTKDIACVDGPQSKPERADIARAIAALPQVLSALIEAREALHFHYTEWDGEPEDAVPLQLARSTCDAALAAALIARSEAHVHD